MFAPRKVAVAAVGGGLTVTGLYGFLVGEAKLARRAIGTTDARPPSADGVYGAFDDDLTGRAVKVLVLGDSAAVGYGMDRADATPPAMLGLGLSHVLDTPVEIRSLAVVGARTKDVLTEQLPRIGDEAPDVVVIIVGVNDITHSVPVSTAARQLGEVVQQLTDRGCEVVVGTCPDLGTIKPIMQPLRAVAHRLSRQLAARQHTVTIAAGGRPVALASLLGQLFTEKSEVMFGLDRFHPSEVGYANMMSVLLPAVAASLAGEDARDDAREIVEPGRRWHRALRRRRLTRLRAA